MAIKVKSPVERISKNIIEGLVSEMKLQHSDREDPSTEYLPNSYDEPTFNVKVHYNATYENSMQRQQVWIDFTVMTNRSGGQNPNEQRIRLSKVVDNIVYWMANRGLKAINGRFLNLISNTITTIGSKYVSQLNYNATIFLIKGEY